MSKEERTQLLYQSGDLRWKLLEHQLEDYDAFRAWNIDRQTPEHIAINRQAGATYHNIWLDEISRRWGKTGKAITLGEEEGIKREDARGMIFTPLQKSIGGIIVPLTKILFHDAPPGYFPKYRTTKSGSHQGLEIPATGTWIKLVGVDKHSDALRGEFLDFCIGTEAAFVRGSVKEGSLAEIIQGTIQPQFRYRPWGFVLLESSTAKQPDHDFNAVFREDAQLRRQAHGERKMWCFRTHTIDEVTNMTAEEIEIELDQSGGRNHPKVRREYFCEEVRDPEGTVVPEFDAPTKERPYTRHVVPAGSSLPRYARCYVGMDQGYSRDPLGLLFGVHDFERNKIIFVAEHFELNMGLHRVGEVTRETEARIWWTQHRPPGDKTVPLIDIRDATRTRVDKLVLEAPEPALTYWHEEQFKPNPYKRVCDVAPQMVGDLAVHYALNFEQTAKDDPEAARNAFRLLFTEDRVEIWAETCPNLVKQLRSGVWNELRTDYERTPTLGHLDVFQAGVYLVRNVDWRMNPFPPAIIDTALHGYALPVGVDKNTATGRPANGADTRFRNSPAVRQWR
jgi:hypothetical protein